MTEVVVFFPSGQGMRPRSVSPSFRLPALTLVFMDAPSQMITGQIQQIVFLVPTVGLLFSFAEQQNIFSSVLRQQRFHSLLCVNVSVLLGMCLREDLGGKIGFPSRTFSDSLVNFHSS